MTEFSRAMRAAPTEAERLVWQRLRHNQLGARFRRQHRMAGYIVDFVCLERRLIVEIDGGQHAADATYDEKRSGVLTGLGFRVVRFWNNQVLEQFDDVLAAIAVSLAETLPPHPNPLPRRRRGRGSREVLQRRHELPLPQAPLGGEGWGEGAAPEFSVAPRLSPQLNQAATTSTSRQPSPRHLALQNRATLNTLIRHFFAERDVLEVETPHLSSAGNTDPNIESFTTQFSGHRDAGSPERWLRTSPEFPLKRLLAEGIGDCYELGRVFRNGEAGRRHNPEFTMLEWYRVGWNHRALMDETQALVQAALAQAGREAQVLTFTYRGLFLHHLGIDPFTASEAELAAPLAPYQIDATGLTRDDWLDLLITHCIQPTFSPQQITLIHDYPASQCALARIRRDGEFAVAERFELYLGPYELANGYHELNDAAEQRARFERDNARRRERGLREVPLDENLLAALAQLPDCAGVALGVERLLMCLAQTDDIREVLAFPFAQA